MTNAAVRPLDTELPWHTIVGGAREFESLRPFIHSAAFTPGAVYRVLETKDGKVPMYEIIQARGVLDSELFPESLHRTSFDEQEYAKFVRSREIDIVVISNAYNRRYKTDELRLLETLATDSASCDRLNLSVQRIDSPSSAWNFFRVTRSC
jgi:hypothetical protein